MSATVNCGSLRRGCGLITRWSLVQVQLAPLFKNPFTTVLKWHLSVLPDLLVLAIVASATHLKHTKTLQSAVLYSKSISAAAIVVHFLTLKSGD